MVRTLSLLESARLYVHRTLLLTTLLVGGWLGAQAQFTYSFAAVGGTYNQVSAGGTDLNSIEVDDAHSATITLPFAFGYNGAAVTAIKVNSNGWISMDTGDSPTTAQSNDNSNFGSANGNVRPGIFPLWDDLDGASGTARYETTGSAPNRVFTMEWRNWQWNYQATGVTISFECKLYETTNVIEFVYRQESGSVNSASASIGLLASASGTYYSLNGTGTSPTASTSSATINLSAKPATGQIYRFTPAGCTAPSITSISSNSPICVGSTLNLSSAATGTAPLSYAWTGTGTFSSTSVASPTVTGAATGSYSLVVRNWCGTTDTDNTSVTVNSAPTASNAGTDQTICVTTSNVTLAANVPGTGTGAWTVVSGPSTSAAQFSSTAANNATFTPAGGAGTYTLRWTITNAPCTASTNDVQIIVRAIAPTASVGGPQTICASGTTTALGGNTATPGTGAWSVVSGGTGTFSNAASGSSTFTHTGGAGPVVLRWTISNSPCASTTADVSISITPATTVSNAGTDQTFCLSSTSTTLAANTPVNGTGAWSILAGSPNTSLAQLSDAASPTATFTPTMIGTYTLRWTISNAPCAASTNDVVLTVQPFAAAVTQTFNADGSFVVPAGVTQITVQAWGGGASGGGSTNAGGISARGGGGGGGGAYVTKTLTVTPGSNLSVLVAAAVNGTSGANGTNGNPSTIAGFEPQVFAAGGSAGTGNTGGGSPAGGAGGTTAASQGDSETAGTTGGNGATGTGVSSGAGGAGANGGAGGTSIGSGTNNGNNGTAPGGGGGGSRTSINNGNRTGGTGAAGRVIISYTPVPSLNASASSICQGSSTTLTAAGGTTYLWSPGGETTASITVSPSSTTTYGVTITNTCPETLTHEITVTPPASPGTNGSTTVCSDGSAFDMATFLGAHDSGGSWTLGGSPHSNMFTPGTDVAGVYTYTVSGPSPCGNSSATVTVNVNTAPNAGSDATTTICTTGVPTTLISMLNGTPDVGGAWTFGGNPVSDSYTPGSSTQGTYTYTVTGVAPCGIATATVTISETPTPTWYADTDGDGFGDPASSVQACIAPLDHVSNSGDGCVNDPTKQSPGICGCDTPDDDSDGDGVADCIDPCPTSVNNGDTDSDGTLDCDDLCPNDPNKIYPGACGCGTPDADADGDTYVDCLDACPNDPLKIAPGTCGCGNPEPGMACNDNNVNTINDVVNGSCQCAGTLVVTCANDMILDLVTDANGSEISWSIEPQGGGAPVAQGSGYASNATLAVPICLPNGNYVLRVLDSGNNGIASPGGYILRTQDGRRIVDDMDNGGFAGQSVVSQGFKLPLGNLHVEGNNCDRVDFLPTENIRVTPDVAVSAQYGITNSTSGYEWCIYNPNGGYHRTVFFSHALANSQFPDGPERATYFRWANLVSSPVPHNMLLNVRVRPVVAGVAGSYGPACRFKIDTQPSSCITTQLIGTPGPTMSCGATGKVVKASGHAGRIYAQPAVRVVNGMNLPANSYLFEIVEPISGYMRTIATNTYTLVLGQWYTAPLLCGTHNYSVRVRVSFDNGATYCPYGNACGVSITNNLAAPFCTVPGGPMAGGDDRIFHDGDESTMEPVFSMWPNPNNGEQLYMIIDGLQEEATTATVDLFNLVGQKVATHTIPVNGSTLNTVIPLNGALSNGLYVVNVTVGEQTFMQRLVID